MSKHTPDPREHQQREQSQREIQQAQEEANRSRQQAENDEVAGRHKNDGQKDHKGADKGPRGQ